MYLDYILDEFDGQVHRSKVKVMILKKLDFYGLCVSIHHGKNMKKTLGRRNFTTRVAGGVSMLRRFPFNVGFHS